MEDNQINVIKQVIETGKGAIKLTTPIQDGDNLVEELKFDLRKLSGMELCAAFDTTFGKMGTVSMPNHTQLLHLFAKAAAKCTEGVDEKDIAERMGFEDAQTAVELTMYFFKHASRAGNKRICSE